MKIAIDFDGTLVVQDGRRYDDVISPLVLMPGALDGLKALKRAGHLLLLWSARMSRALLHDPALDPFVRAGVAPLNLAAWKESRFIHRARRDHMLAFVRDSLPGIFDAIDDGSAGKPSVDLFIDDKALKYGWGGNAVGWVGIARTYGDEASVVASSAPPSLMDQLVSSLNLSITGRLEVAVRTVIGDLRARGILLDPQFILGDNGFWTGNMGISINLPWFLANEELWNLSSQKYTYTLESVMRTLRHEVGHAVNYGYELWRRKDWDAVFGDIREPYREDFSADPAIALNFIEYLKDVPDHYAQKHPDEDWAETFAAWLDPAVDWRTEYAERPMALAKLRYVDLIWADVLKNKEPVNLSPGLQRPYHLIQSTVRDALGLEE